VSFVVFNICYWSFYFLQWWRKHTNSNVKIVSKNLLLFSFVPLE
jgi:hypothetical protein